MATDAIALNDDFFKEVVKKAKDLQNGVSIKDRRYLLRLYPKCFIGAEFIDWVLYSQKLKDRIDALNVGQKLMDSGFISHVVDDQSFEDGYFFYRFNDEKEIERIKKERSECQKEGWMELKGLFGNSRLWFELRGNILRGFSQPKGKQKVKYNFESCEVTQKGKELTLKSKKNTASFVCDDEEACKQWSEKFNVVRQRSGTTRKELVQEYKKLGEVGENIAALENEKSDEDYSAPTSTLSASKAEQETLDAFKALLVTPVKSVEGEKVPFETIFKEQIMVVALLRHFG